MPSPADFPLGSPQSRAVARALVVARKTPHHLSQADEDALTIYCGMVHVDVRMTPSYEEIERLDVYAGEKNCTMRATGRSFQRWRLIAIGIGRVQAVNLSTRLEESQRRLTFYVIVIVTSNWLTTLI
jgi:hypothetical protein